MTSVSPETVTQSPSSLPKTQIIACGALAREIMDLIRINGWTHLSVTCLPAIWHNTPHLIPDGLRKKIAEARGQFDRILIAYGDCGTGGLLDKLLEEEGVERIDGPHCYSFFSGNDIFAAQEDDNLTAFFLTDYLVRHFDRLIIKGMGLDRFPELLPTYFAHYTKVVYLAQIEDDNLIEKAKEAATRLELDFEYRLTGYGELASFMSPN